jgi:hypothetical protein
METKYYEYVGTQKQADKYADPKPILGNMYPSDAKIGGEKVSFWLISTSLAKEWKRVEEQSTEELIELLNKKASKDGLICSVTFEKKPGIEIIDFPLDFGDEDGVTSVLFSVNIEILQVQSKQSKLIEAIKTVLEND